MKISSLPDAEYAIMQIVWEQDMPITTMQAAAIAGPLKGWHFKTVQTLLRRLVTKGFLASEKYGRDLHYTYVITRDEYIQAETDLFMSKIHNKSLKGFISALYADGKPSETDIAEIEAWLNERKG